MTVRRSATAMANFRIFHIGAGPVFAEIRGLTISGGRLADPDQGGGIHVVGNLRLRACVINDNRAASGGGIYVHTLANLTVIECFISGNEATTTVGGGIYNNGGIVEITGNRTQPTTSLITGNTAQTHGGAIFNGTTAAESIGRLVIEHTHITGNQVRTGSGAAIFNLSQQTGIAPPLRPGEPPPLAPEILALRITGCTINGNTVMEGPMGRGSGGGVYNDGKAVIINSTFQSNTAGFGGGLLQQRLAGREMHLRGCTISGNTSTAGAGAAVQVGGIDGLSSGGGSLDVLFVANTIIAAS